MICGGSDSTTLTAAQKFLRDCYYYQPGMQRDARDVPVGTAYTYRHDYKLTLTLSGTPLEQFTIVYQDSTGHLSAAQHLQRQFSKVCGLNLPLASAREYGGGNAILLGMADLNGSHLHPDYGAYSMALACREQAASIQVIVDSTADLHLVAQAFADTALTGAPTRGSHDIRLPDDPRIYCVCTDTMYALALQQTTAPERISDGLLYHRRLYSDKSQKPVVAHVMEVDLAKLDILNATPQYGDEIYHVRSTTLDAMKAVENAGFQAVAGVNADFFRIRGDCSPEGLCIKQGKLLSDPNGNPWFGITADGKAVMGTAADYSKYAGILQEAVGASTVLLKNGFVEDVEYDSDERSDRHPRTFLGTRPDGTVVIVAVDGRQEMLSNGASWSDMAQILLELDVTDGVNLDGGGSTTFITASEPGVYTVRNSPSGGTLREVYNSLVIVKQ